MKDNRLRTLWQQDRPAVNAWLSLRDGFAAELMAHQGFDALTVDLQHGLADTHTMLPLLQANFIESNPGPVKAVMALAGLLEPVYRLPLVAPSSHTLETLRRIALDMGLLAETASA